MRIRKNPDTEYANEVLRKLKDNSGFCPCKIQKIPENKCMCKKFLEMKSGMCHCGLYIKEDDEE